MNAIATIVMSFTPFAEIFYLLCVGVAAIAWGYVVLSRSISCILAFVTAAAIHCLLWYYGPFGDNHWEQFRGVLMGDLWRYPYAWTWVPFIVYWIIPWPIAYTSHALWHRQKVANQRLQLTGNARESTMNSAGADEGVPPRAAGN